ncbi:MAG: VWA domain-containing protein [Hyphomicrobiaceae bacterium]
MTDKDMNQLRDYPVPPPTEAGRKAALAAARVRFAASQTKAANAPKETASNVRPMIQSQPARSFGMLRKHMYAMAATVAVIAIGAPVAIQMMERNEPTKDRGGFSRTNTGILDPQAAGLKKRPAAGEESPEPAAKVVANDQDRGNQVAQAQKPAAPPPATTELNDTRARKDDLAGRMAKAERERVAGLGAAADRKGKAQLSQGGPAAVPALTLNAPSSSTALDGFVGQQRHLMPASPAGPQVATGIVVAPHDQVVVTPRYEGRDQFPDAKQNPIKRVAEEPVSTFSVDVDTASYGLVRRQLNAGRLPPKNAVRIEELVNYFPYDYPLPEAKEQPFQPTVTIVPSPWHEGRQLVHVAIKGYQLQAAERPRANLVFLIDTSGSMAGQDRLPLVRNALRMLVDQLKPEDTIGIVTYAGNARAALAPTAVSDKSKILSAIEQLQAGGSTAGAEGLQQAYQMAEAGFDKSAVNRIVLATDGDFNVGLTDHKQLESFIETKRHSGVFLSILGVGIGNHNDRLMQALAQAGNGVAAHIDTLNEARKVLVEEATSTLFPIAKDVKIQVEFNPERVSEYRLVGYETRGLKREDFNNDKVDAGDVGSGHSVTAIYEIAPVGVPATVDALRYGKRPQAAVAPAHDRAAPAKDAELGYLKLRYKLPQEDKSRLIELPITPSLVKPSLSAAPVDVRFAIAVAGFGELLRHSPEAGKLTWDEVIAEAMAAKGPDPFGYRAELVNLARLAKSARP